MSYNFKYAVESADTHSELAKHVLADGYSLAVNLDKSHGSFIYDDVTNSEFLDLFTCYASMPIGYNHPKMLDKDFIEHIGKIALNKPANSDLYSKEYATFVNTFFNVAIPDHFKYSFFIDGGALAVENALKVAFDWKTRMNLKKNVGNKELKIIYFREAFHGRSGYTMTLTNTSPSKVMYFPKFDWIKVDNPKIQYPINEEELIISENASLEQIDNAFRTYEDQIAAIIIEPIQGEGGDNHFRNQYLQNLKDRCLKNDALLIFDEVQTGGGLTGSFWVHEQLDVQPDVLAFGKKMQVCGVLASEKVDEVEDNVFKMSSRINSTWGGNLVDMVRVTKYLEIIEEENLLQNAKEMGNLLQSSLNDLSNKHDGKITNVRGKGLFVAFDMDPAKRDKFISLCFEHKLIILYCGEQSIRFRPPLNINKEEILKGIETIDKVLELL